MGRKTLSLEDNDYEAIVKLAGKLMQDRGKKVSFGKAAGYAARSFLKKEGKE